MWAFALISKLQYGAILGEPGHLPAPYSVTGVLYSARISNVESKKNLVNFEHIEISIIIYSRSVKTTKKSEE